MHGTKDRAIVEAQRKHNVFLRVMEEIIIFAYLRKSVSH